MASPIKATPTLRGKDAEALLESLRDCCSEEEMARRQEAASRFLARIAQGADIIAEWAAVKAESRRRDEEDLASGKITR